MIILARRHSRLHPTHLYRSLTQLNHQKQLPKPPIPPFHQSKKPPLIGPGPIRNDQLSASFREVKTTKPESTHVFEASKRDLEDAERHGLMKPPPPDANALRRLVHKAVELFKFYFRGVKLIYTHRKTVAEIHRRIKSGGPPMTRAEFRFIQLHKEDIKKLIPFIIIVLVLEEVIPLIAIYAPFLLPSTCVLPSQKERIDSQKAEKAALYLSVYQATLQHLTLQATESPSFGISGIAVPDGPMSVCGILRISTVGPDFLRLRRIRRHLLFVARDDRFLVNEDMGTRLSPEELRSALEERGLLFAEASLADQRGRLRWWLQSVMQGNNGGDQVSVRIRHILHNLVTAS